MNNLEKAKELLFSGGYTCVLFSGDTVYTSNKKGIAPVLDLLDANTDLRGFSIADRIIGKAAAMLFALAGVKEVFSEVVSEPAIAVFSKHNISYSFDTRVDYIINRTGDGVCPMEQAVKNTDDLGVAYKILKEKLAILRKNQ